MIGKFLRLIIEFTVVEYSTKRYSFLSVLLVDKVFMLVINRPEGILTSALPVTLKLSVIAAYPRLVNKTVTKSEMHIKHFTHIFIYLTPLSLKA